jgi:hypothetical protein
VTDRESPLLHPVRLRERQRGPAPTELRSAYRPGSHLLLASGVRLLPALAGTDLRLLRQVGTDADVDRL